MLEFAEIFRRHGPAYRAQFGNRMPPNQRKVMADIEACRTEELGGHGFRCEPCQE
jgi:Transposase zinc-binding domain